MNCNYCRQHITRNLTLAEIFLPKRIITEQLCSQCSKKFRRLTQKDSCKGCQKQQTKELCTDCIKWQKLFPNYEFHHEALFSYDQAMQEWMEEYKFKGNYQLRHSFALDIKAYFKRKSNMIVVAVPVSKKRMASRGFNQVAGLLDAAGIAHEPYLVRFSNGLSQVQKNRQERMSLEQPFKLTEIAEQNINNKEILLVDDIYTTGRTIFHAAEVILEKRPAKLHTFSLAR
ncbi:MULTISPECIES: ComF family protein [unclassified Enterococcus]|uniref:ComF family protein n=1 Tax=unclassified Enterococcus TaxID=2608891 RepID=UPI001CE199B2|nr:MULTISPECIES: phosphoribosyltransferase family protein [unclassified Enterococcus]MCA5013271.1 ComF family protein [Enterococcus sp. S23]MCA5016521.1 ComF family protein [Enterococcus sp. S22(2020)]